MTEKNEKKTRRRKLKTALQKAASAMSLAHWATKNPAERSKMMKAIRGHGPTSHAGGRPRSDERCYCGERSWNTATIRRFDCCKRAGKYPTGKDKKTA